MSKSNRENHGASVQCNIIGSRLCNVLLATARIQVKNAHGSFTELKALVDQGSQNSFITEEAAKILGLKRVQANVRVSGIGNSSKKCNGLIGLTVKEKWNRKTFEVDALVLGKIVGPLPNIKISEVKFSIPRRDLADPSFEDQTKIDILLGADIYGHLLLPHIRYGKPTAQKTIIGWILSGPTSSEAVESMTLSAVSTKELDAQLRRFWEQEEIAEPITKLRTKEEEAAEEHYKQTTVRGEDGKYIVRLPFKEDPRVALGPTMKDAIIRYNQLEQRLMKNPKLEEEYNKCIREYLELGHMEEVPKKELNKPSYYMPHHAVIKAHSTTTKVRPVFNASHKTSTGKSLNSILMVGPTIQKSIYEILLRWRTLKIVVTADAEKMYRNVWMDRRDIDWQRFLWRPSKDAVIKHYRGTTIFFGEASGAFSATRTLQQLAEDEKARYPEFVGYIEEDIYMDDFLSGANTVREAIELQQKMRELLAMGGFKLRKWTSNNADVLQSIPESERGMTNPVHIKLSDTIRTLGLEWHPQKDVFMFKVTAPNKLNYKVTKRFVTSNVAKLFDPLGWLQPVIVTGKIFIQKLWLTRLDWDEEIPDLLATEWHQFFDTLKNMEEIRVPRWIEHEPQLSMELHGFSDTSEKAMAAVIYVRVIAPGKVPRVYLLTAKTKVAPLRSQSIPRLELNAALMLVKLMSLVQAAYKNKNIRRVHYWTDSTVVLDWLKDHASRWKTYIANRVSEIQAHTNQAQRSHIRSEDNPTDIASRGVQPRHLINCTMWWKGPKVLTESEIDYTTKRDISEQLEERLGATAMTATPIEGDLLNRFSSYSKLIRVIAYCKRFGKKGHPSFSTSSELNEATKICVRMSQSIHFAEEIKALTRRQAVKGSSPLGSLAPHIDAEGILRVGGRLHNAKLPNETKHQIVISNKCNLAKLIVLHYHMKTLHGGIETVGAAIRQRFWILRGQNIIKSCIHKCIKCYRCIAQPQQQMMAPYPACRVSPARPFAAAGLDFAGPISIKWSSGRGAKSMKSYIALFVCLSTKAMHLELVSDLTSQACIAAIKRFVSRRGKCKDLYTDCGTNFVGANKQLKKEFEVMMRKAAEHIANDIMNWLFNPPSSPHFGGLWEAGVKSVKRHITKTIGETKLDMEGMYTLLAEIEACLNSRPLAPISDDMKDPEALTPSHFLIGESLMAIPENSSENNNLLTKWKHVVKMKEDFWQRWHKEYLTKLQKRPKWLKPHKNFEVGQLVLVKTENYPSTKWPLARITEVHPGADNLVRVVTLIMKGRETKRPVHKLCPLPIMHYDETNTPPETSVNVHTRQKVEPSYEDKPKRLKISTTNKGILHFPAIILSVMIALLMGTAQAVVDIHNLTSGFYVEHLGQAHMSKGSLKLRVSVPWDDFTQDKHNVSKAMEKMVELCRAGAAISAEIHCGDLNEHLFELQHEISHRIDILQNQRSRVKRGLLGSVLTTLFGVNDVVYHDIENLSTNQQQLIKSMDKQTKIVLRATQTLNATNARINEQLRRFKDKLTDAINRVNKFNYSFTVIDHNKINLHFLGTYQRALNYLNEVSTKYNLLFNVIYSKYNILSIIAPNELMTTLNRTESVLTSTLRVLHRSMLNNEVSYEPDGLYISGHLPIIEDYAFDLIKATAVPEKQHDDIFSVHEIPAEIIGINFDQQLYYKLTEESFKRSYRIKNHTFVTEMRTLYDIRTNSLCLIKEIFNLYEGKKCTTRHIRLQTTLWKQLYDKNKWIFAAPKPEPAHTICGGTRQEIRLAGTGLLSVSPDCIVSTRGLVLSAEHQAFGEVQQVFTKSKPITFDPIERLNHIEPINVTDLVASSVSFSDVFREAEEGRHVFELTSWRRYILITWRHMRRL